VAAAGGPHIDWASTYAYATAIAKFNKNDPQFRDRDLFVFCFNRDDGKFTAHEAFVAHDVRELRDAHGTTFGKEIYSNAKDREVTEIVFISSVPGSTELAMKSAFVTRIDDQVCGVSAYQIALPHETPCRHMLHVRFGSKADICAPQEVMSGAILPTPCKRLSHSRFQTRRDGKCRCPCF
jgi:hypothetical protein